MNIARYAARREKLRELMAREGLDALLISHPANRFYLSGFELHDCQCNESSGHLIILRNGKDWLCTDSRYEESAAERWDRERVFIYKGPAAEEIRDLIRSNVSGRIGIESAILSHDFVTRLEPGLSLEAADGLVEELRVIKDEEEIRLMEESARLNHQLMEWLPSILTAGNTEANIAWSIEKFFREHGATESSFSPIVARDAHAALPHYNPFEEAGGPTEIIPNCHILVDVGARLGNYCSDQTRTFWVGNQPEKRFLDMLDAVREAQRKAIAAIRPGMIGKEAWEIAMNSFAARGVEKHFTHSLGHGVGLETHEEPRLSPRSEKPLKEGMIVTVEPGLYYPGWGGARWEYMVIVEEDGCRVL